MLEDRARKENVEPLRPILRQVVKIAGYVDIGSRNQI
jgi:hypothetical protein